MEQLVIAIPVQATAVQPMALNGVITEHRIITRDITGHHIISRAITVPAMQRQAHTPAREHPAGSLTNDIIDE